MSSFRVELRPLIGTIVTVVTTCGSITGRLVRIGIDKIVVRTSTARFIIRIAKICFVRRVAPPPRPYHRCHRGCW